ncbi:MAG: response regulator [Phycisphaerae bacterium]|nr:response regulator [Gemmatimonadaceae bacterium]
MTSAGHILLADDEPTFLNSTADLLRAEGYTCETVADGDSAIAAVSSNQFDLLITDLEMPGNSDLELVKQVAAQSGGLPVIILTGYPSVRSAVACIELPVAAYLTKPVSFPALLERVVASVQRFRSWQGMQRVEERLRTWQNDFEHLSRASVNSAAPSPDVFLSLTLRNVMGSLTDLDHMTRAINNRPVGETPCQLMNCPRGAQLQSAVTETIRVLEETKGAFKSQTLGELRRNLELLLKHV